MKRYEYDDGKSSKFWEIDLQGEQFTVRFGKIGTDGQTLTKVFGTDEKAKREAQKKIREKTKKGYNLVHDDKPQAQAAPTDRHPELEAAILANPDDKEAWTVYADWLGTIGDVRGELIGLLEQLASATTEYKPIRNRIAVLKDTHLESWLGDDLLPYYREAHDQEDFETFLDWKWAKGFLTEFTISVPWAWKGPDPDEMIPRLVHSPAARFLRKVGLGIMTPDDSQGGIDLGTHALAQAGHLPTIRDLHIGAFEYPTDTEISWSDVGDVGQIYEVVPNLEFLHVQGGSIDLGNLVHPKLKGLKLETGGLPGAAVEEVASGDLPELLNLEMWLGADDYGAGAEMSMLAPLLEGKVYPKLQRLGLMNTELSDEIAAALPGSEILRRIEVLDLSMGTLLDRGARHILDNADAFRHLHSLDLDQNFLSDEICSELQAALGQDVKLSMRHQEEPDEEDDGEYWTYVSVGE